MVQQQAVIFDLEGVLVDHLKAQCSNTAKALEAVGVRLDVTPEMYQLRSYPQFHDTADFLLGLAAMAGQRIPLNELKARPEAIIEHCKKLPPELVHAIKETGVNTFNAARTEAVKQELPWFRALEFLRVLKEKGIPVFIVTAAQHAHVEKIVLEENGIVPRLVPRQNVLYGEDNKERGKDVLFAQVKQQMPPETKFLVVEDSLSGIKVGQKLGMQTALVLTGNTGKEMIKTLEKKPDFVVNGVHELLGTAIPVSPRMVQRLLRWKPIARRLERANQRPGVQQAGARLKAAGRDWLLRRAGKQVQYPKGMRRNPTHPTARRR